MNRFAQGIVWVLVMGVIGSTNSAVSGPAPDPESKATGLETPADALETARALLKKGNYAEAEVAARGALERAEQANGANSFEAGRALDVLAESLRLGGKAAEPGSHAIAERAVRIKEAALGSAHPEVARSVTILGHLLLTTGDYTGARPLYERALAIREAALAPDHPDVAKSINSLASVLLQTGEYAAARPFFERALAIQERALGPDHPDVAQALYSLANLLGEMSDYVGARTLLERSRDINERALGRSHPSVAACLSALGRNALLRGDFAAALSFSEDAVTIQEDAFGGNHPDVATSLTNLANVHYETGSYSAARSFYRRALAIMEKSSGAENVYVGRILNNLASIEVALGDYAEALRLYERAVAILEKTQGSEHTDVAGCLDNIAIIHVSMGNYTSALSTSKRALAIRQNALPPGHPDIAQCISSLAVILHQVGNFTDALQMCQQGLAAREKAFGPAHPAVAFSVSQLAAIMEVVGDRRAATSLAERALVTLEEHFGAEHPHVATCLSNLASLLAEAGDYADARPLYERALGITEKAVGPDHPDVAERLSGLAGLFRATNDRASARSLSERALVIRQRALGPNHPDTGATHSSIGTTCLLDGDFLTALDHALQAESIGRQHFRVTARGMAESQASRYSAIRVRGLDVALAVAAEGAAPTDVWRIWDSEVHSRAVLLDEMAARHRVLRESGDPAVDSLFTGVGKARARLANLTVRGVGELEVEVYRKLLDEARQETDEAERLLAEQSASFQAQRARTEIGLSEVLNALPAGAALVAYCRYEEPVPGGADSTVARYLAFVAPVGSENSVDGSSDQREVSVVPLGAAAAVDSLGARWRDAVSEPAATRDRAVEETYRMSAAKLREAIWDPVVTKIGESSTVFVVPDGPLHLVSLATLPTAEGGYIVEEGPMIHYLSAERDLVPDKNAPGSGLLMVGNPNYDSAAETAAGELFARVGLYRGESSRCEEFETLRFERLPGTEKEAKAIGSLWKRLAPDGQMITSRTGPLASEARIKEEVSGKRVVHLATHGFFVGEGCPSVVETTRGLKMSSIVADPPPVPKGENPLRLSGLALAGANRRGDVKADEEDGILTAEEVAALDLTGVEWAVLSACGTGVGEVRSGEGVFGLRRAFETAGAGTLIMSLWSVQDEAARAWMERLYHERLEKRRTTAEAVREASRSMLVERRRRGLSTHPFSWGAFIGAGEWR